MARDIEKLTGLDMRGADQILDYDEVRHMNNRHGANGEADKSMSNPDDVARMNYILDNYDVVDNITGDEIQLSSKYRDRHGNKSPKIEFRKRINGHHYVITAVQDAKNKKLRIISTYIEKAKKDKKIGENYREAHATRISDPTTATSKTYAGLISPNEGTIAQDDEIVKGAKTAEKQKIKVEKAFKHNIRKMFGINEYKESKTAENIINNMLKRYKDYSYSRRALAEDIENLLSISNLNDGKNANVKNLLQSNDFKSKLNNLLESLDEYKNNVDNIEALQRQNALDGFKIEHGSLEALLDDEERIRLKGLEGKYKNSISEKLEKIFGASAWNEEKEQEIVEIL